MCDSFLWHLTNSYYCVAMNILGAEVRVGNTNAVHVLRAGTRDFIILCVRGEVFARPPHQAGCGESRKSVGSGRGWRHI